MSAFSKTLAAFCEELRATFPELKTPVDRAAALTPAQFWKTWSKHLPVLVGRDSEGLMGPCGGFLMGPVRLSKSLWSEVSETTQGAIWRYLRTLTLEASMELGIESLDTDAMQALMSIMLDEKGAKASPEFFAKSMDQLKPLLEKLKGLLGGFMDTSGSDTPMPEIPERLRNGRIAKLAEDMAKQFDPADFGIDPAVLKGEDIGEIMKRLAELYQKDPTLIMAGAKRVAEKIKKQILGGSLKKEDLIAEAQEYMDLFKEHPLFKDILGKVEGFMGGGGLAEMFGSGGTSEPSERRRAVQERLRKKLAARTAAASEKKGGPG
jgi:hypothetical protein